MLTPTATIYNKTLYIVERTVYGTRGMNFMRKSQHRFFFNTLEEAKNFVNRCVKNTVLRYSETKKIELNKTPNAYNPRLTKTCISINGGDLRIVLDCYTKNVV